MEDIHTRSFDFAVRIIRLCAHLEDTPGVSRTISRQLSRSGTSVGANLRETRGAQSRADFIAKVHISLKEAHETLFWLELITATGIMPKHPIADLVEETDHIIGILTRILISTKKKTACDGKKPITNRLN